MGRGRHHRDWWPVGLLVLLVVFAVGGLLWFIKQAVDNERLVTRQKLDIAYEGYLKAGRERLQSAWEERERLLLQSIQGLPPAEAFSVIATQGLADSVILSDRAGQPGYPSLVVNPPSSVETVDLVNTSRALVQQSRYAEAAALMAGFEDASNRTAKDAQGRVQALNTLWLLLDMWEDVDHPQYLETLDQLVRHLKDYRAVLIPATQRRFLMKAVLTKSSELSFPTLRAEAFAARVLLNGPDLSTSQPGIQPAHTSGTWILTSSQQGARFLFHESTLMDWLGETMSAVALPANRTFHLSPIASGNHETITKPLGEVLTGWQLGFLHSDEDEIETITNQSVSRIVSIGLLSILILSLLTWAVGRSILKTTRRAQLKENLAASISHEVKTPLASMRLLVDVLLEEQGPLDQGKTREYLELIAKENRRLSSLVTNFLAFSRIDHPNEALTLKAIDPGELLRESGATARQSFAGERLVIEDVPELQPVKADRPALMTALLNLLDNACKYSPQDQPVTLRGFEMGRDVCFEVEDRGTSLSKRDSKRIFEIFRRLTPNDSPTSGCGLGLHLVRSVAERFGGRVEVQSAEGTGNRFRILIPKVVA